MNARRTLTHLLLVSFLIGTCSPSQAGVILPKGAEPAKRIADGRTFGDGSDTAANKKAIEGTLAAIKENVGGVTTDEEARALFNVLRARIVRGAALVKRHDNAIGTGVEMLLAKGKVNLDLVFYRQRNEWIYADSDNKAGFTEADLINVTYELLLEADGVPHKPETFGLVVYLYYIGSFVNEIIQQPDSDDRDKRIAQQRRFQLLPSIKALTDGLALAEDVLKAMNDLAAGQPPAPASNYTRDAVASIAALGTAEERIVARIKLRGLALGFKQDFRENKERFEEAAKAYKDFIDGTITKAELNKKLNEIGKKGGKGAFVEPLSRLWITPSEQPGQVLVVSLDMENDGIELHTPFERIMDIEAISVTGVTGAKINRGNSQEAPGGFVLVSGLTSSGTGGVIGFADTNDDGLLDDSEMFEVIPPTPLLQSNLDIFRRPGSAEIYIYDGESGAIYRLEPGKLGENIAEEVDIPRDFLRFEWTQDGMLFVFDTYASAPSATVEPGEAPLVLILEDKNLDGRLDSFNEVPYADVIGLAEPLVASFEGVEYPLRAGDEAVTVRGTAGHLIEVVILDAETGDDLEIIGSFIPESVAPAMVTLSRPLGAGEVVVARDTVFGLIGQAAIVEGPPIIK